MTERVKMFKILIKNGIIIDGSGEAPFCGDLLIHGGLIAKIGKDLPSEEADEIIHADGKIVAPGFIDPHTHADLNVIFDRQQANALFQGITTQIVGLCGLGYVPLGEKELRENLAYSAGLFGYEPEIRYDFSTFKSYMGYVNGAATNIAVAGTHNASRIAATGWKDVTDRADRNIEVFHRTIREGMEAGCVGFSTGLSYYPCAYSTYEELVEIGKILAEYDGVFMTHIRYPKPDQNPYDILDEMINVAKETGVRIHILHYKTKYPLDYGRPEAIIDRFEKAQKDGCNITLECSPYNAGSTFLHTVLPGWAMKDGYEGALKNLSNPALRSELREDMQIGIKKTILGNGLPSAFTHVGNHPEYAGRTFDEIMKLRGQDLEDMIIDVLFESKLDCSFYGRETLPKDVNQILYDDIIALMRSGYYLVGSDSMPYGEYPHPRTYGCFAKMFRLSREYKMPMEEMIHIMTWKTAQRFRLFDRGLLKEGKAADVIVFNPENYRERSDFDYPRRVAAGMDYVIVNGRMELEEGLPTGLFGGTVLKRS